MVSGVTAFVSWASAKTLSARNSRPHAKIPVIAITYNKYVFIAEPPLTQKKLSVAVRWVCWINAAGLKCRAELGDAIALREYGGPPNHSGIVTTVRNGVHETGRLDECATSRHFF